MTEDEWDAFFDDGNTKEMIWYAERGDHQPLVDHLKAGGEIGPILRDFYIKLLRGEVKKRRGTTPVRKNRDRNADIAMQVWMIAKFGNDGNGMSIYQARKEYLARNSAMNPETLKTICSTWGVSKEKK